MRGLVPSQSGAKPALPYSSWSRMQLFFFNLKFLTSPRLLFAVGSSIGVPTSRGRSFASHCFVLRLRWKCQPSWTDALEYPPLHRHPAIFDFFVKPAASFLPSCYSISSPPTASGLFLEAPCSTLFALLESRDPFFKFHFFCPLISCYSSRLPARSELPTPGRTNKPWFWPLDLYRLRKQPLTAIFTLFFCELARATLPDTTTRSHVYYGMLLVRTLLDPAYGYPP